MSSIVKVDTIQENTSANGITVDGLNIKDSRSAYDQFGHAGVEQGGNGFGGGNPFGGSGGGFGDIFGDIFGGGNSKPDNRGSDLRYDLEIDLMG